MRLFGGRPKSETGEADDEDPDEFYARVQRTLDLLPGLREFVLPE